MEIKNDGIPTHELISQYKSLIKNHNPQDESHKGKIGSCFWCIWIESFQFQFPLEAKLNNPKWYRTRPRQIEGFLA